MSIEYIYPSQNPRYDAATSYSAYGNEALYTQGAPSFKDLLDVVNPLQQLPVVGTLYRAASGDEISTFSRLAGGALLGGPIGFLAAALNAGLELLTGDDIGGHVVSLFDGGVTSTQTASAAAQYARIQQLS